ncbi:MAG: VIT1/CCC1 transporter family protein [Chlamydiota bacterium]
MTAGHFEGKSVKEHLKSARAKGAMAAREVHGAEMSGQWAAFADAAKDTTIALLIVFILAPSILPLFACGWILWKTARSARLGWTRLERLHRLIEEERWEIEHHRSQEREELTEMYREKGFSGKLLEEVIDVLMADDEKLLRIMLEEELGLTLEAYEHPLKQALGAGLGALFASLLFLAGNVFHTLYGPIIAAFLSISAASILLAKLERNRPMQTLVWNLAVAFLVISSVYFLHKLI